MPQRSAYTLFELILVMAILVITATIAFPLARSYMTSSRLTAASDIIRTKWAQARSKAIEENRPFAILFKEKARDVMVVPWQGTVESSLVADGMTPLKGTLPEEIEFGAGMGNSSDGWFSAGVIYPDGTALEDVKVSLGEKEGGRTLELSLRAFTGTVSSEQVPSGERQ